jgi:hypothetical protein
MPWNRAARVRQPLRRLVLSAILVSAALSGAACGGSAGNASAPPQDAGLFYSSLIREKATGQYDLVWKSLHPLHQRIAPEGVYVKCENRTVFPGRLVKVSVVRVKDEPVQIAGEKQSVESKAVTLRVSVDSPGIARPVVVTGTYHAIAVEGRWTWILTRENFVQYKAGRCPGAAPLSTKA